MLEYIKSLFETTSKEAILKKLKLVETNFGELHLFYLENLEANKTYEKITSKEIKQIDGVYLSIRTTKAKNSFWDLGSSANKILDNVEKLHKLIDKEFANKVFTSSLSAKQIVIMRSVDHLFFLADIVYNYLYYFSAMEGKNKLEVTEGMKRKVAETPVIMAKLMNAYSDDKLINKINDVQDIIITEENEDALLNTYGKAVEPFPNLVVKGLSYNPIFYIRKFSAELDVDTYYKNQQTIKMLKIRIAQLKIQQEQNSTAAIDKELNYELARLEALQATCDRIKGSVE